MSRPLSCSIYPSAPFKKKKCVISNGEKCARKYSLITLTLTLLLRVDCFHFVPLRCGSLILTWSNALCSSSAVSIPLPQRSLIKILFQLLVSSGQPAGEIFEEFMHSSPNRRMDDITFLRRSAALAHAIRHLWAVLQLQVRSNF